MSSRAIVANRTRAHSTRGRSQMGSISYGRPASYAPFDSDPGLVALTHRPPADRATTEGCPYDHPGLPFIDPCAGFCATRRRGRPLCLPAPKPLPAMPGAHKKMPQRGCGKRWGSGQPPCYPVTFGCTIFVIRRMLVQIPARVRRPAHRHSSRGRACAAAGQSVASPQSPARPPPWCYSGRRRSAPSRGPR